MVLFRLLFVYFWKHSPTMPPKISLNQPKNPSFSTPTQPLSQVYCAAIANCRRHNTPRDSGQIRLIILRCCLILYSCPAPSCYVYRCCKYGYTYTYPCEINICIVVGRHYLIGSRCGGIGIKSSYMVDAPYQRMVEQGHGNDYAPKTQQPVGGLAVSGML